MNDNIFLTVKLTSGEEILCTFVEHGDDYIEVMHPMVVKSISYIQDGNLKEHVSLKPWSSFSSDVYFLIQYHSIIWFNDMHDVFVKNYLSAVQESIQEVDYEEVTNVNELHTRVKTLSDSIGIDTELFQNLVDGNDTIN